MDGGPYTICTWEIMPMTIALFTSTERLTVPTKYREVNPTFTMFT